MNEEKLLESTEDADETYVYEVLPEKMKYNLNSIRKFNVGTEIVTMVRTVVAVCDKKS